MPAVGMDYFRRPRLSGNVLGRLQFGTIHGSIRRNDADNTSSVPYFPGLSSGMTLGILLNGATTVTATFTDSGYLDALTAINTALGANGTAFDTDGSISIQAATAGGLGSVEVVASSNSAALVLGFGVNPSGASLVRSSGGDLNYTPEDRIGNESSTGFPGPHEGLTTDALDRALGRVSANADILYTDDVRDTAILQQVSGYTVSADGTFISLPASTRVFTGYNLLSNTSEKEDLAPFFMVMDSTSRTPSGSKVTGVVRGTPLTPGVNASSFADTAGHNILGLNLAKLSSVAINASGGIQYGRYVECTGTMFTTIIVPGDVVQVTGATNTSPWNNNGMRWIVEAVVSDTILELRPMSQSELTLYGVTAFEAQPILELNETITGSQSYGSLTIYTGTYTQIVGAVAGPSGTSVNLCLDPPLPAGSSIEVWVAQPLSTRKQVPSSVQEGDSLPYREMVSSYRTLPDAILSGFSITYNSGPDTLVIGSGVVRQDGRLVNFPGITYSSASTMFAGPTINYFWYDPLISNIGYGAVNGARDPADYLAIPTTEILMIGSTTVSGSTLSGTQPMVGTESLQSRSITVGDGGQFSTLEAALGYISTWATAKSDVTSSAGDYSHWDIVLVSDYAVSTSVTCTCAGLRISGATPSTKLVCSVPLVFHNLSAFMMENLQVDCTSASQFLSFTGNKATNVTLRNLYQLTSSSGSYVSFASSSSGSLGNILIYRCNLNIYTSIYVGIPAGRVDCLDSIFTIFAGTTTAPLAMFTNTQSTTSSFSPYFLRVQGCRFLNMVPSANSTSTFAYPMLLQSAISGTEAELIVRDNVFTFQALSATPGVPSQIISCPSGTEFHIMIEGNVVGDAPFPCHQFVNAALFAAHVRNNTIYIRPELTGTGIKAGYVESNRIDVVNADSGQANNIVIQAQIRAVGNYLSGNTANFIVLSTTAAQAVGNYISMSAPVNSTVPEAGILCSSNRAIVSGNIILGANNTTTCDLILINAANSTVADNYLAVENNSVGIYIDADQCSVVNNNVACSSSTAIGIQIASGSSSSCILADDTVEGTSLYALQIGSTAVNSTGLGAAARVKDCFLNGAIWVDVENLTIHMDGNFFGGNFTTHGTCVAYPTSPPYSFGYLTARNNYFGGTFVQQPDGVVMSSIYLYFQFVRLSDNIFIGNVTCADGIYESNTFQANVTSGFSYLYANFVDNQFGAVYNGSSTTVSLTLSDTNLPLVFTGNVAKSNVTFTITDNSENEQSYPHIFSDNQFGGAVTLNGGPIYPAYYNFQNCNFFGLTCTDLIQMNVVSGCTFAGSSITFSMAGGTFTDCLFLTTTYFGNASNPSEYDATGPLPTLLVGCGSQSSWNGGFPAGPQQPNTGFTVYQQNTNIVMSGCWWGCTVKTNGSRAYQFTATDCYFLSNGEYALELEGNTIVNLSGCYFSDGNVSVDITGVGVLNVHDCYIEPEVLFSAAEAVVTGTYFGNTNGAQYFTGTSNTTSFIIRDCTFEDTVQFSDGSFSSPYAPLIFENNTFQELEMENESQFFIRNNTGTFIFVTQVSPMGGVIEGNQLYGGAWNTVLFDGGAPCLYIERCDDGGELSIANNLLITYNYTNPGTTPGNGLATAPCIYFSGTGSNSFAQRVRISDNYLYMTEAPSQPYPSSGFIDPAAILFGSNIATTIIHITGNTGEIPYDLFNDETENGYAFCYVAGWNTSTTDPWANRFIMNNGNFGYRTILSSGATQKGTGLTSMALFSVDLGPVQPQGWYGDGYFIDPSSQFYLTQET
jgi:hypothetical protein